MTIWMVRAGVGNTLFQPFLEKGIAAIGWAEVGDLNHYNSREEIVSAVRRIWPAWKPQAQINAAGMLYRFSKEMQVGDGIVSYNQKSRIYAYGRVDGEYHFDNSISEIDPNIRSVNWLEKALPRDKLSIQTKNTLGSTLTLFLLSEAAEQEILRVLEGDTSPEIGDESLTDAEEETLLQDIEARSIEFIKDRIVRLEWDQMQELVAAVLRAIGYKTRVSPKGADRGKDIVASPDGFGFEDPRIIVEVKHRAGTSMGSQDIRSFLGGRHPGDKGLYVSTGGFSKDANYEAERANIPVTLMDLDSLVEAILENYDKMDPESQRLVPLRRILWPVN